MILKEGKYFKFVKGKYVKTIRIHQFQRVQKKKLEETPVRAILGSTIEVLFSSHAHFPRRFSLVLGDSLETLPKYADQHKEIFGKTDLFFVDGGHEATVAQSDLFWAIAYLNKENEQATIVMDDLQMNVVRTVWDRMIASFLLIDAGKVTDSASGCVETDPFLSVVSTVRNRASCKRMQGYVLPNADPVLTEMNDVVIGLARVKRW